VELIDFKAKGFILADQIKDLDWNTRKIEFNEKMAKIVVLVT
jgi:hypothetical protein